jgi:hypothetical protein
MIRKSESHGHMGVFLILFTLLLGACGRIGPSGEAATQVATPEPPCWSAKIDAPTAGSTVGKRVPISWTPADCQMQVQVHQDQQSQPVIDQKVPVKSGYEIDLPKPSQQTEIKIWAPGSPKSINGQPTDNVFVDAKF